MVDTSIPALVKRLRVQLELTQEQFAHKVGVAFSAISQRGKGRRRPQNFF